MLRWQGSAVLVRLSTWVGVIAFVAVTANGCSKSPSGPSELSDLYLGVWQGSITSDTIGRGTLRLSVGSKTGQGGNMLISGAFAITFAAPSVTANGNFSGSGAGAPNALGLFFDRSRMPCPSEPGGTSDKVIVATVTVADRHMSGRYVVAGCPGGAIDLVKE